MTPARPRVAKVYHVRPRLPAGWQVEHEGARRPSAVLPTMESALERARQLSRLAGSRVFFIHLPGGQVRTMSLDGAERER